MEAYCAEYQAFLVHIPIEGEFPLHSLEQETKIIDLNMKADKTEFMHSKQNGTISTLNDKLLKLEYSTYLGSKISYAKGDVNVRPRKA